MSKSISAKIADAIITSLKNKGVPQEYISSFAGGKPFEKFANILSKLWSETSSKKFRSLLIKGEYGAGKSTCAYYIKELAIGLENTLFLYINQEGQMNIGKVLLTSSEGRNIRPGELLREIHTRIGIEDNRYNEKKQKSESRISVAFDAIASSLLILSAITTAASFGIAGILLMPFRNYARNIRIFFERKALYDKLKETGLSYGDKLAISFALFLSYKKYRKELSANILKFFEEIPIVEGFFLLLLILGRADFKRVIIVTDEFGWLNSPDIPLTKIYKLIHDNYTGIATRSAEEESLNSGKKPIPGLGFVILSSLNDYKNTKNKESFSSCISEISELGITDKEDYSDVGKKISHLIGLSEIYKLNENWENELDTVLELGRKEWEYWFKDNGLPDINLNPESYIGKCPFRFGIPIMITKMTK
ncbi:MAG: hypothetical protein ABSF88_00395 [Candidatus Aminicenantales bacterium]